jgi:ABC-type uncharacterized transport system permease subunit
MKEEQIFLNEGGVTVTNARFVVPSQTYAMSGITSVKSYEKKPLRRGPILLIIIGVLMILKQTIGAGFFCLVVALIWWMLQKTEYQVRLSTASGEATALKSNNTDWIIRVVSALNEAIIHRG